VKEEIAFSFIKTMLHAGVVTAPSPSTTIARLTDLLISVQASRFGLIVNNIQTMLGHCESSPLRFFTDDFDSRARVSWSSGLVAAVVKDTSGCFSNVKEKLAVIFIKTVLHASSEVAPSSGATIARLTNLLISVETSQFGLVVNNVQVCDANRSARVARSSGLVTAVVKNASGRRSDVKEEVAFSFTNTVLHALIVTASRTLFTIARLADLLISVRTCYLGLVVNHIETLLSRCESPPLRIFTDDFDSSTRVGRNSSFFAAVVKYAAGVFSDVKEEFTFCFIKTMLLTFSEAAFISAIARLADPLFSVVAGHFGLVIHDVEVCNTDGRTSVVSSSRLVAAVVKNASRCFSDVEEELTFSFIMTVLHANLETASSTLITIARLADLLT